MKKITLLTLFMAIIFFGCNKTSEEENVNAKLSQVAFKKLFENPDYVSTKSSVPIVKIRLYKGYPECTEPKMGVCEVTVLGKTIWHDKKGAYDAEETSREVMLPIISKDGKKVIRPYLAMDVSEIPIDELTLDITTDLYLYYEDGTVDTIFAGFYKYVDSLGDYGGYEIILNEYAN